MPSTPSVRGTHISWSGVRVIVEDTKQTWTQLNRNHMDFNMIAGKYNWDHLALSRVRLFATPSTVAHQAPLSTGFSWQEYWSGLPFPSPGDLPNPGIEPGSPALQADALSSEPPGKPIKLSK